MNDRKTASELEITDAEYEALIKVREGLASGCMVHVEEYEYGDLDPDRYKDKMLFNMSTSGVQTSCGTVACIGGWMKIVMTPDACVRQMDDYVWINKSSSLDQLFFPSDYDGITTDMAVEAIDNFLTTGDPRWREVLPLQEDET